MGIRIFVRDDISKGELITLSPSIAARLIMEGHLWRRYFDEEHTPDGWWWGGSAHCARCSFYSLIRKMLAEYEADERRVMEGGDG